MSEILFISDLHLTPERPETLELFLRFLQQRAQKAKQLYILGDLFDAWIGDDNEQPPIPMIQAAMAELAASGTDLFIMQGNRDFLLGERFANSAGATLLPDPTVADLFGTSALLMHGDTLCTDDQAYMQFRKQIRNPGLIDDFLSRGIPERLKMAAELRRQSGEINSVKASDIMDVNQQTVESTMLRYKANLLIHGHTHRPGEHRFLLNGEPSRRLVLSDWRSSGGELIRVAEDGITREPVQ